jgi:hypothetical protein
VFVPARRGWWPRSAGAAGSSFPRLASTCTRSGSCGSARG